MSTAEDALHREVRTLYTDHHGWLIGWLRRRLGDSFTAADLAHDTFTRLLARDEAIEAREPRAFLTTVALRVLSNHWRRQQLEHAYLEALAQQPQAVAMSTEERAMLLELLDEIDRRLDGLPVIVRRAFLLTQLDGLGHAEVAERLDISIATVKRHLVKAAQRCYFALA